MTDHAANNSGEAVRTTKEEWKRRVKIAVAQIVCGTPLLLQIQRLSLPKWKILTYHRVVDPEDVPYPLQPGMFVRPETFRMQMKYLCNRARVVPLQSLLDDLSTGRPIPPKTIALTFDDGWRDTHEVAFPILKEQGLPATVFLATSFLGTAECFWPERVLRSLTALRRHDEFHETAARRIRELESLTPELREYFAQFVSSPPAAKIEDLVDRLIDELKRAAHDLRTRMIADVVNIAREFCNISAEPVFMTWDDVRSMSVVKEMTFASHSHHHHNMTDLREDQLRDEVSDSLQSFRDAGVEPLKAFCYPGGYSNSLTQRVLFELGIPYNLATTRESSLSAQPKLLGRINMHEDVTATESLFAARVWLKHF